jgi:lysyl-tRNA synthetase class 2
LSNPSPGGDSPFWDPARHADRRGFLAARGQVRRALRDWFESEGFTEVEAGQLAVSPGNEAHLAAYAVEENGRRLYLHTSPEFAMKKLLAAGETRIFEFARVFRRGERGPLHAPEFTMLEWYRAGSPVGELMADSARIVQRAADAAGARWFEWRGRTCEPRAEPERLPAAEAFSRFCGIDLLATLDDRDALAAETTRLGLRVGDDDDWSDLFSRILSALIEPQLGIGRPTLLTEYPICEAALARPAAHDPRVADRFELYCCGVELANGFGELTDPVEQRRRFEIEMNVKDARYGERYPIDEDFLAALARMPDASGVALGFDRLVMLASGARRIDEVLWTPVP